MFVGKFVMDCALAIAFCNSNHPWVNYKYGPSEIFFLIFVDYIVVTSFSYHSFFFSLFIYCPIMIITTAIIAFGMSDEQEARN